MTRGWSAKEIIEDELLLHERSTYVSESQRRERTKRILDRLEQAGHLKTGKPAVPR